MSALNFRIWQRQTASLGPQKYSHIAPIHHICNEGVASRSAADFANVIIAYILIVAKKVNVICESNADSRFLATHTDSCIRYKYEYSHSQSHLYAICWRNRHKWLAGWPATCCCDYVETLVSIFQPQRVHMFKFAPRCVWLMWQLQFVIPPLTFVTRHTLSINAHWNLNLCHILNCLLFNSIYYTRYVKTNKF